MRYAEDDDLIGTAREERKAFEDQLNKMATAAVTRLDALGFSTELKLVEGKISLVSSIK